MKGFRAFLGASYGGSHSSLEAVSIVAAAVLTGLTSAVLSMRLLVDATILAGEILGWIAEPSLVPKGAVQASGVLEEYLATRKALSEEFSRLLASNFWITGFIVAVTGGVAAYIVLSKVSVQLPVLMYRVQVGPARLYLYSLLAAWLWTSPVSASPILAVSLVSLWAGLDVSALLGSSVLPWFAAVVFLLPLVYSSTYIVSGRFDYSMILSVFLVEILYVLAVKYHLLGVVAGALILALVLAYEYYRVVRWRWGY